MNDEEKLDGLEKELNELVTVVMGPLPNRNNGIRGDLNKLVKRFEDAMDWAHNIWNVKRRDECIGLIETKKIEKRLDGLDNRLDKFEKGDVAMGVAKVNLTGVYVMSIIQMIGLIVVALIANGCRI